jgi:hypothetical protein
LFDQRGIGDLSVCAEPADEVVEDGLQTSRQERNAWLSEHPEAARRLRSIDRELHPIPEVPEIQQLGRTHAAGLLDAE